MWDQDQETAIQAPLGGTKVAWGGPPTAPRATTSGQRFDLSVSADDRGRQVERLLALGATRLDAGGRGGLTMADPGGNEFRLLVPDD